MGLVSGCRHMHRLYWEWMAAVCTAYGSQGQGQREAGLKPPRWVLPGHAGKWWTEQEAAATGQVREQSQAPAAKRRTLKSPETGHTRCSGSCLPRGSPTRPPSQQGGVMRATGLCFGVRKGAMGSETWGRGEKVKHTGRLRIELMEVSVEAGKKVHGLQVKAGRISRRIGCLLDSLC